MPENETLNTEHETLNPRLLRALRSRSALWCLRGARRHVCAVGEYPCLVKQVRNHMRTTLST